MKKIQTLIKIVEANYSNKERYFIEQLKGSEVSSLEIQKFYKDRLAHGLRMLKMMENIMLLYPNHFSYEKYEAILTSIILHDIEKEPKKFTTSDIKHGIKGAEHANDLIIELDIKYGVEICEAIRNHSDKELTEKDIEDCDFRFILVCLDIIDKMGPNTIYLNVSKNPLITYDELFSNMKDLYMKVNKIIQMCESMDDKNPIRRSITEILKTRNRTILDILATFQLDIKTY